MGSFADALARYAQPLVEATDGSPEDLQRALSLSQLCWNLALLPEEARDSAIAKLQSTLNMDDDQFQKFKGSVVAPMMQRHRDMFPAMRQSRAMAPSMSAAPTPQARPARIEKYPGTGRNEKCPCNSGRKYKVCCGR